METVKYLRCIKCGLSCAIVGSEGCSRCGNKHFKEVEVIPYEGTVISETEIKL